MERLLEKILRVDRKVLEYIAEFPGGMGSMQGGWITPSGDLEDAPEEHEEDAARRMKELTGKEYRDKQDAYLDFMRRSNYIRCVDDVENAEVSISVASNKITSSQFSTIRRLAKENLHFYYDVYNPKTGKKDYGEGYREFTNSLRKLGLHR